MNIEEKLKNLKIKGITVWKDGEKLKFRAP